ncbi:MAG TPA: hypothetical protein ENG40_04735 [Thermoprotei archaeon]|nr:hypothetical protein [Thermoprotei archaeon]
MSLEEMRKVLIKESPPQFISILIGTEDGLPIISTMSKEYEKNSAGLLATILNTVELLAKLSNLGKINYIISNHEEGGIFVTKISSKYYILIIFEKGLKEGILFFHVKRIISKIKKYLTRY